MLTPGIVSKARRTERKAESLIACRGFDPVDQLQRYVRWWRHGHLSSTSACVDIGTATLTVLRRFERTGEPFCGSTGPSSSGNGWITRLAPVPTAFARTESFRDGALAVVNLGDDADTTGAVFGQIAGAFYGEEGIPSKWRSRLSLRAEIEAFAGGLLALAETLA